MFRFLLYTLIALMPPANASMDFVNEILKNTKFDLGPEFNDAYTANVDTNAPKGLKDSYLSSVVIETWSGGTPIGSGSGNYFKLGKDRFIITAAHVVLGSEDVIIIEKSLSFTEAKVVYVSEENDIAVLVPKEKLRFTKALHFKMDKKNEMGEKVYHTGHPAREGWHMSEGLLTGTREDFLLINTFAWPGSSGSVVFDESGRVIGVLSSIRVDVIMQIFPQFVEHIVSASNIKNLEMDLLKEALRDARKYRTN